MCLFCEVVAAALNVLRKIMRSCGDLATRTAPPDCSKRVPPRAVEFPRLKLPSSLPLTTPLQIRANLPPGADGWGISLRGLMSMVVVGGLLISAIFWWLNRTVSGPHPGRPHSAAAPARQVHFSARRPCFWPFSLQPILHCMI